MTTGNIDYATLYFKYKIPTRINSEPTYQSLKRLKTELRANASSVDTDLGGGDHGYLGLVLSDAEYARISPQPVAFVAPNFLRLVGHRPSLYSNASGTGTRIS